MEILVILAFVIIAACLFMFFRKSEPKCLTTINGDVYDVTDLVKTHSGGSEVIENCCGKDCTETFTKQHDSSYLEKLKKVSSAGSA